MLVDLKLQDVPAWIVVSNVKCFIKIQKLHNNIFFLVAFYFYFILNEFADFFDIYDYTENLASLCFLDQHLASHFQPVIFVFAGKCSVIAIWLSLKEKKDLTIGLTWITFLWYAFHNAIFLRAVIGSVFHLKISCFYYHHREGFPLFFIGIVIHVNLLLTSWRRCRISLSFFFSIFLIFFATIFHTSNFVSILNPFCIEFTFWFISSHIILYFFTCMVKLIWQSASLTVSSAITLYHKDFLGLILITYAETKFFVFFN